MRNALWALCFGVLTLLVAQTGHGAQNVATEAHGLRAASHPDGTTRIVFDLGQSLKFKTRLASDPMRIIVDTEPMAWSQSPVLTKAVGPFTGIGYAQDETGGHLTLRLGRPAEVKSAFLIAPRDGNGWRFVIDAVDTTKQSFLAQLPAPEKKPVPETKTAEIKAPEVKVPEIKQPEPRTIVVTSPNSDPQPVTTEAPAAAVATKPTKGGVLVSVAIPPMPSLPQQALPQQALPQPPPQAAPQPAALTAPAPDTDTTEPMDKDRKRDGRPVIVIDPGHGGVDPGATSISGMYEKYVTFGMARELQHQLEKTGHYRVRLTRDRDQFIRLRDRIAISRQYHADLFISLHADVVKDPLIHGLSVYTLSQDASDTEAQSLADKENKADLIAGVDLSHESTDVANILIDLAQRETMNRSAGFAGSVVEELERDVPLLANTHRFAGFAVLKAPDVPAVLIEMGYLSNPSDEKNLLTPDYRAKLARAISRAVDRYFIQGQKAKRL